MEQSSNGVGRLTELSKRFGRRLLGIARNRLELLLLEVREERDRLLRVILLALGVAAFGLLGAMALSAAIVVVFWEVSHLTTLLVLAGFHGAAALWLYRRLTLMLESWQNLPATLEQLRKDRACLERELA